jgi:5-hydroxyisourate hydrolase
VTLERESGANWNEIAGGVTDDNGRIAQLLSGDALSVGSFRLTFFIEAEDSFYPKITVQFRVRDAKSHYHVPLLLSPYGYTTYRGS